LGSGMLTLAETSNTSTAFPAPPPPPSTA
jgi:hypothetical protein